VLVCVAAYIGIIVDGDRTGTIQDVEHIVIFMQENRAYDHYYGSLRGVRGFNDRAAPLLPSGRSPFYQPVKKLEDNEQEQDDYMLPYPLLFNKTSASCMPAPRMAYPSDIGIMNNGNMDGWNTARSPGFGMSYFNRSDLPYYYALADAFTIGDQYFQSTFTATCPNREHLFSGSNGLSVSGSGFNLLDDSEPAGMTWLTMGEVLEAANISWKLYQGKDNFDDNGFAWFEQYKNATPGEPLYDKGMARQADFVQAFADDVGNGTLPQVSWLVGPARLSEHATHHPADGEDLSARILKVLSKPENKDIYSKTVFILNYDEGGQFYDHHWTPTPPNSTADGKSTVTTEGELTLKVRYGTVPIGSPIGLGFRVPLFIISPWSRGDYVYSEVTDHTSTIQFIEKRFGVHCPNISPWRRAVTGDLTAAFNFTSPDYSWPDLPDTSGNVNASNWQCDNLPMPTIPTTQHMPVQEEGTKLSRALPYEFYISDNVNVAMPNNLTLTFNNTGTAGAVFNVYDRVSPDIGPRKFTVEGGKILSDVWSFDTVGKYELSLHGPNGFVRQFLGTTATAPLSASLIYDTTNKNVTIVMKSVTGGDCDFTIVDNAYEHITPSVVHTTSKQNVAHLSVHVSKSGNWYDLSISSSCIGKSNFMRRFMGRMETGETTTSDPAMGKTPNNIVQIHPPIPDSLRHIKWDPAEECKSRRSRQKDICWPYLHDEL